MNPTGDTPDVQIDEEPSIPVEPGNAGSRSSSRNVRDDKDNDDQNDMNEDGQIRYDGGPIPRK